MKQFLLFLLLLSVTGLTAQVSLREQQMKAYLSNDKALSLWKQVVTGYEAALSKMHNSDSMRYELALAQYGLMNATLRTKDEDLFDQYYDNAIQTVEELTDRNKGWSEPYALQSALYGIKMGYSPMQGMVLGSKSNSLIEKAKKLNSSSPFAWKVYANSKLFTPEMFGGDVDEAIRAYQRSVQLYEATPALLVNNWHYLDALAFLGQAYMKKENKAAAVATFEKALKAEPNFYWVKNSLLPKAKALK